MAEKKLENRKKADYARKPGMKEMDARRKDAKKPGVKEMDARRRDAKKPGVKEMDARRKDAKKPGMKEMDARRKDAKKPGMKEMDARRKDARRTVYREERAGSDERKMQNGFPKKEEKNVSCKKKIPGQICPVEKKCGGCQFLHMTYEEQLAWKQKQISKLMKPYCRVYGMTGMEQPLHYRNKVHAAFTHKRDGEIISGIYEEGTHRIVPVEECLLEDQRADAIIRDIRKLLKSFKIKTYNEDTGYGLFRHALIRCAHKTGQILVVLVLGSPILPSKNNFVNALLKLHPEITSIVLNVNDKKTSMVLGEKEKVLYGKGYIEDELCGRKFRISPKSFYQINSVQTEYLYGKAMELAALTGKERVIDAYCGIGTIGLVAAKEAGEVIGVELNPDAVRDAVRNAKMNEAKNISFYENDAGVFMTGMAEEGEHADVVFMDPPRAGSDEAFLSSVVRLSPSRIVYISCNPETLARDTAWLVKHGYKAEGCWGFDMFPFTEHVETVCLLSRVK